MQTAFIIVKKNQIDSKSALETKPNRREVTEKTVYEFDIGIN